MNELESIIKNALFSRRIMFNIFAFDDAIVVQSTIRGSKLTVNVVHVVTHDTETGIFNVKEYDKTFPYTSKSSAAAKVVSLIRKQEMRFSKFTKKK